jgi:hypothetical protein
MTKVVQTLARQRSLKSLSRHQVRSLRLGVRVLADVSDSMVPFARDRQYLLTRVREVVGPDRTEVHQFVGCPMAGTRPRPSARLKPFEPPSSGTPLLVLSDLGIGTSSLYSSSVDIEDWIRFTEGIHRSGCRLVTLVPFSPERWPTTLRRHMTLIHWDRHTTARAILQALQRSR